MDIIKKIIHKIGMDGAIAYSSLSKIIQAGGGFFTIIFIAKFLTPDEQGYYYTFGSVLAIQLFFELGLGGIITQYVAHEATQLKLEGTVFRGTDKNISRLSSLLHLFIKWYLVISGLLFCTLIVVGYVYFSTFGSFNAANWFTPWIILCVTTSLNLFISPLIAFIEGIGRVKDIAFLRLITQITSLLLVWGTLSAGGKLYASAIAALVCSVVSIGFIWKKFFFAVFRNLWKNIGLEKINYKQEILPYQWRIALSWISGYFIFQLFNPVLFAYAGPKIAGQTGMTLTVLNAVLSLVLSWTSTKVPLWSSYISKKEYKELDISFAHSLKSSTVIAIAGVVSFMAFLVVISQVHKPMYDRFLPLNLSLALLFMPVINNVINAWATYLRCHKKEPFLIQAVVVGILTAVSTFFTSKFTGVEGVVYGYVCIVLFVSLPLSYYIFKTKKREYHGS